MAVLQPARPPSHQSHLILLSRAATSRTDFTLALCEISSATIAQPSQTIETIGGTNLHCTSCTNTPVCWHANVACSLPLLCSWVRYEQAMNEPTWTERGPLISLHLSPRRSGPPWTNRSSVPPSRACVRVPGLVCVIFALPVFHQALVVQYYQVPGQARQPSDSIAEVTLSCLCFSCAMQYMAPVAGVNRCEYTCGLSLEA